MAQWKCLRLCPRRTQRAAKAQAEAKAEAAADVADLRAQMLALQARAALISSGGEIYHSVHREVCRQLAEHLKWEIQRLQGRGK